MAGSVIVSRLQRRENPGLRLKHRRRIMRLANLIEASRVARPGDRLRLPAIVRSCRSSIGSRDERV